MDFLSIFIQSPRQFLRDFKECFRGSLVQIPLKPDGTSGTGDPRLPGGLGTRTPEGEPQSVSDAAP